MPAQPENKRLVNLISTFRKEKKAFWKRVGELLNKPRRKRIAVNISKINRYAKEGYNIVIPGKVLGDGEISMPIIVAAFGFSKRAKKEIEASGGKAISLEELYNEYKNKDNYRDLIIII